jgi:hypothetical protein
MEEGNSLYDNLKKFAPELKWLVNTEIFDYMKRKVRSLAAKFNSTQIEIVYESLPQTKK